MLRERDWPTAEAISTSRLVLEPLRVEHAAELAPLLDDQALHAYIGGEPASLDQLTARYEFQVAGRSPDGDQGWLNWVVRLAATEPDDAGAAVGTVQATVSDVDGRRTAELAWVIATRYQRRGYAVEAASGMVGWLRRAGVEALVAHVHPEHHASIRVAEHLGLAPTDAVVDGEIRWASTP